MEDENKTRRFDYKTGAAGLGLGLALYAIAPLDDYLGRRLQPVEEKIVAMKEVSDLKLDNLQKTVDEIKTIVIEQGKEYNTLNLKVLNLEFIVDATKPKPGVK